MGAPSCMLYLVSWDKHWWCERKPQFVFAIRKKGDNLLCLFADASGPGILMEVSLMTGVLRSWSGGFSQTAINCPIVSWTPLGHNIIPNHMYVSVNIYIYVYILYTHNCTWYCHCLSKFPHDQYGIMFIFCWVQFHSTPLNPTNQPVIIPVLVALFLRGASPGSSPGRSAASRSWWGWRTWDGIKKFHGFFEGIYWDLLVMCWKVVGFSYFLGRDATTTGTSPTMVLRWWCWGYNVGQGIITGW